MFLNECKDSKGAHVPLSFTHTEKVLKALKEADPAKSKEVKSTTTSAADKSTAKKSAVEKPKETTGSGALKVRLAPISWLFTNNMKVPNDLAVADSSPEKVNENQTPKSIPHTKGVAVPKKKIQAPGSSKSTPPKSSSGVEARSPLANQKRPLATNGDDETQQQGEPAAKKARKENELALPEVSKEMVASVAGPSSPVSSLAVYINIQKS